jgi:hypothetical protein
MLAPNVLKAASAARATRATTTRYCTIDAPLSSRARRRVVSRVRGIIIVSSVRRG